MARDLDPFKLSSPRIFLIRMLVFLILCGLLAFVLLPQIRVAFMANPALNGLIVGVMLVGIAVSLAAVLRKARPRPAGIAAPVAPAGLQARIPRATYRLQFHKEFGFDDAIRVLPYLAKLGVSHVYCSPLQRARPGSMHGYDVDCHSARAAIAG